MLRRALFTKSGPEATASLPAGRQPTTSNRRLPGPRPPEMRPDIPAVLSTDSTAESALAIFEQAFKERVDTKTDIQQ